MKKITLFKISNLKLLNNTIVLMKIKLNQKMF